MAIPSRGQTALIIMLLVLSQKQAFLVLEIYISGPHELQLIFLGNLYIGSKTSLVAPSPLTDATYYSLTGLGSRSHKPCRLFGKPQLLLLRRMLLKVPKYYNMGLRVTAVCAVLVVLALGHVEAVVDLKKSNRDATEADFWNWVTMMEAHDQTVAATITPESEMSLEATSSTTLYVGNGGYSKVQDAVDDAPSDNGRTTIQIASGTYWGHVTVPKGKTITFQGVGNPVLVYDDTASSAGSTSKSASVVILADYFIARGVTFQNSAPAPAGGAVGKQAVALRISGDKGAFFNCNFLGAQDTLYDQKGRHYFKNCYIEGSIDFICGDGQSIYQSCHLNSIAKPGSGSLTAQKRTGDENTGFSFVGCTITGKGPVYLGRAWGPNSRTVFIYCNIADMILPQGWYNWGESSREKTVFYGQYKCTGAGADESKRVSWSKELTASQASALSSMSFIDGSSWVPSG